MQGRIHILSLIVLLSGCFSQQPQSVKEPQLILGDKSSIYAPANRKRVLEITKQLEEKPLADRVRTTHDLLEKSYGQLIDLHAFGGKCQQQDNERVEAAGFTVCRRKMRWGSKSGLEYRIDTTYRVERVRSRSIKINNQMEAVKILFDDNGAIKVIEFMYEGQEVYRMPFVRGLPNSTLEGTEVSKETYQKFERLLQVKKESHNDRAMLLQYEVSRVLKFLELLCLEQAYFPACVAQDAWRSRGQILKQL